MNMKNKKQFLIENDVKIYRQKILFLLKNDKEKLAKNVIKMIFQKKYLEEHNIDWLYDFFSPIYDELFYDLMFENIKVSSKTRELLETLALPIFKMDDLEKDKLIKKYQKKFWLFTLFK